METSVLTELLLAELIPINGVGMENGELRIDFKDEATTQQRERALEIQTNDLAIEIAVRQAKENAYIQAASIGITVSGVSSPLAATPIDWQYYTNLLAICQARKAENLPDRSCKIATMGAPHTFATNQEAIDALLAYSDTAQTLWEAALE